MNKASRRCSKPLFERRLPPCKPECLTRKPSQRAVALGRRGKKKRFRRDDTDGKMRRSSVRDKKPLYGAYVACPATLCSIINKRNKTVVRVRYEHGFSVDSKSTQTDPIDCQTAGPIQIHVGAPRAKPTDSVTPVSSNGLFCFVGALACRTRYVYGDYRVLYLTVVKHKLSPTHFDLDRYSCFRELLFETNYFSAHTPSASFNGPVFETFFLNCLFFWIVNNE